MLQPIAGKWSKSKQYRSGGRLGGPLAVDRGNVLPKTLRFELDRKGAENSGQSSNHSLVAVFDYIDV